MSHPNPLHDRENERTEDNEHAPKRNIKHEALQTRKFRSLKVLKQMIAQPSSKHWFMRFK